MDTPMDEVSAATHYAVVVDLQQSNNPHTMAVGFVGRDHRVLEVGCSSGYVTEQLVRNGNKVTGIELDASALEQAMPFLDEGLHLDLDTARASDHVRGPFDVIVLGDVLEHLRDPLTALTDLTTLLAPDGRFVISVPHVAHVDVRLMLLEGSWRYERDGLLDETHLRWFTRESLGNLLSAAGLVPRTVLRVRIPMGGSNLDVHPEVHGAAVIGFIFADPEADTYQFVVEAATSGGDPSLLAARTPAWPSPQPAAQTQPASQAQPLAQTQSPAQMAAVDLSAPPRASAVRRLRHLAGRVVRRISGRRALR